MKKIVIFGCGDHSRVVFSEIIKLNKYSILGFIDNLNEKGKTVEVYKGEKYQVLGNIEYLKRIKNVSGIIGIGSNYKRKKVSEQVNLMLKNFEWITVISKDSIINGNVKIGIGSIVVSNSVINTGTIIGDHCLVNTSSSLDHDNIFANYSSSGPRTTTGGGVKIGEMSHLGISSTVQHKINIGNNTIIGAKSLVNKNCQNNSVYYGVPAKKIRSRKPEDDYL